MNKNQKTNEPQGCNAKLEELLEKGTVTLAGKSRADVYTQAADLMDALPIDATWSRGIVNYDPVNKTFTQVITIKK